MPPSIASQAIEMTRYAREQVLDLTAQIDSLNNEKRAFLAADFDERSPQVRDINGQLAPLYTRRNDLLHDYPALQAEFGKPKRPRSGSERAMSNFQSYVAPVSSWETERRAKALKQSIHPLFAYWRCSQRPPLGDSTKHWKDDGKRKAFEEWLTSDAGQTKLAEHIAAEAKREEATRAQSTATAKTPETSPEMTSPMQNQLLMQEFSKLYYGKQNLSSTEIMSVVDDPTIYALFCDWQTEQEAVATVAA